MKIGIYGRVLARQRTGIGNYVQGLVELLPSAAPQHDFVLYSNKALKLPVSQTVMRQRIDRTFRWCPGSLWLLSRGAQLLRRDQIEIFWSTDPILPLNCPSNVRKIVTVYDLVWLRFPETTTAYNLFIQKTCAVRAILEADLILTISRSTQDELVRTLGIPIEKTRVVYPGISPKYKPLFKAGAADYISTKYRVPSHYMATVGTIEPRKNLKLLVEALQILKNGGRLQYPLLIAGAGGWKNSQLFREIRNARLSDENIRFLGYIPDDDLPSFYAGAQVFLFPTFYEGFGLPPVEAMACGVPVIASNTQPIPEVLGSAAVLEPPTDAGRFASAIVKVLDDESLRSKMVINGLAQSQQFRWEASVKELVAIFGEPHSSSQDRLPENQRRNRCVPAAAV